MKVTLHDSKEEGEGWIDIHFQFDWKLVEIMRSLSFKKFDGKNKVWQIPIHILPELKEKLQKIKCIDHRTNKNMIDIYIDSSGFTTNKEPIVFDGKTARLTYLKRPRDAYQYAKLLEEKGYKTRIHDKYNPSTLSQSVPKINLYDFQESCMEFLRKNDYSGLIALDMGLGKTIVSSHAIHEINEAPVLIIAPSSLLFQWGRSLKKHYGIKAEIITSQIPKAKRLKAFMDADVAITNYELLRTLIDENNYPLNKVYSLIIIDEAHRVKNWKTKVSEAVSHIVARRVITLTGTPVDNNLDELYNIADQTVPASLGTLKEFNSRHIVRNSWGSITGYANLEEVYQKLGSVMFRRRKEDVLSDLPDLTEETIVVPLTSKELSGYRKMFANGIKFEDVMNAKVFASSSAMRLDDIKISSKEKELISLLEGFDKQVVIFTQFKIEAKRLEKLIKGRQIFLLHGDIKLEDRQPIIDDFVKSEKGILIMTEIGMYGVDELQSADTLINFDIPFTHSRLAQRGGRIVRVGSKHKKALVLNMLSKLEFDFNLWEIVQDKKGLADVTIDGESADQVEKTKKILFQKLKEEFGVI